MGGQMTTTPDPLAGETLVEWAYCSRWADGSDHIMHCGNEAEARRMAAQCAHIVGSHIDSRTWETEPGMPHPKDLEGDDGE